MKITIDYGKSPSPSFDAVQDIKEWIGAEGYAKIAPEMAKITNRDQFALYCDLAGIEGFPVKAWYDHFQGQGAWESATC